MLVIENIIRELGIFVVKVRSANLSVRQMLEMSYKREEGDRLRGAYCEEKEPFQKSEDIKSPIPAIWVSMLFDEMKHASLTE